MVAKDDVGTVLKSKWIDEAPVEQLPVIMTKPGAVVYGSLADSQTTPDVFLLRINGLALMTLKDVLPDL